MEEGLLGGAAEPFFQHGPFQGAKVLGFGEACLQVAKVFRVELGEVGFLLGGYLLQKVGFPGIEFFAVGAEHGVEGNAGFGEGSVELPRLRDPLIGIKVGLGR